MKLLYAYKSYKTIVICNRVQHIIYIAILYLTIYIGYTDQKLHPCKCSDVRLSCRDMYFLN